MSLGQSYVEVRIVITAVRPCEDRFKLAYIKHVTCSPVRTSRVVHYYTQSTNTLLL